MVTSNDISSVSTHEDIGELIFIDWRLLGKIITVQGKFYIYPWYLLNSNCMVNFDGEGKLFGPAHIIHTNFDAAKMWLYQEACRNGRILS